MKIRSSLSAAFAVMFCISVAYAQETSQESTKQCEGACPITKAMGNLPALTFKVGDESICCGESAAALAKKHDKPIQFVVGKKTFDEKQAAYVSLVEQTESYVNKFLTPAKCEVSGKTTVAGKSCDCPVQAGDRAKMVKAAASKVKMTYAVGDKSCNCPMEAAKLAKTSGDEKNFVVAGKKTSCEMTARLNLARAKYKAAVEALAAAEKKAETDKSGT